MGAAIGATGGLLAGPAAMAIPGIGPAIGAGWLITALAGAAAGGLTGGLIGALSAEGIDERDAHVFAEGIRRGGAMMIARVDVTQLDAGAAILNRPDHIDIPAAAPSTWPRAGPASTTVSTSTTRNRAPPVVPPLPTR